MTAFGRMLRGLLIAFLCVGSLWLAGFFWYGFSMSDGATADRSRTDAIVVLTGGADRLKEGLRLLEGGAAKWLFVSGVNPGVGKAELMRVAGVTNPTLANSVVIGQRADNTRGNAAESAAWLKSRGFRSLRLVTANYHMRRSLLEFRRALPDARIVANPVFPRPVNPGPWWWNGRALRILAGEFNKYLVAMIGLSADGR